jgi:fermentation-respiration switch protein FrsA (DUF1100 family)
MIVLRILMYGGLGIACLAGAYLLYMLVIAVVPGFKVPRQPLPKSEGPAEGPTESPDIRREIGFPVEGVQIRAWLYLPMDRVSSPYPCIVMAHGLGATKAMGLDTYARRFQDAGIAVLAFDYRHLGESGGEPSQLVWIPYQLADYAAAIAYVRGLEGIDSSRIALWGTSLSGGHVLAAAAADGNIACLSAQVPLLDGEAGGVELLKRNGLGYVLRMTFGHALRDLVRSWLGLPAHKIPLVGKSGSIAVMADDDAWRAFGILAPEELVNEACARILIRMDKYKPLKHLERVGCPVLLQFADLDITNPPALIKEAGKRIAEGSQIIHYPIDHFDIYLGDSFEQAVKDQVSFFQQHLL